jgi:hypothetical protein
VSSQRRAEPSPLPVKTFVPSGEKATEVTFDPCPEKVRMRELSATFHNFAVLSALPVKTFVPSGEKATERTSFVCPEKV